MGSEESEARHSASVAQVCSEREGDLGWGRRAVVALAEPHRGIGRGGRLDALPSRRLALLSEECECYFGGRGEP